ncbi:unnamed protein product [Zymoseptoria tritici ST99CH_1A5]|uniref:F-box domain-containing protein n=1 Tax=Zymoseptoria tritici ST99CH_1A5 TaxID=1276529 RepID=A0A1Y6LY33_ZYMTR|nr:unnamed protein product [Zymoseptoria tritici ST99CH_1A5]
MPLKAHIPDELLSHIFSFLQPPRPEVLGRARYEHIEWALPDDLPAVNRYSATSEKQYLPQLKTDDAQHKLGLATLNSCMRACVRFENIARPLLYESYPGQPIAGLQAFNRTLFRRSDLARMVKFITIGCWHMNMLDRLDRWWKSTIRKVGPGQKLLPALLSKAEAGHEDAQVALLLFLCGNVQAIDLSAPALFHMSVVKCLFKDIAQERSDAVLCGEDQGISPTPTANLSLRILRALNPRTSDTSLSVSVSAYDVLLQLPTITRLTLHRMSCQQDVVSPPMPQLQELCLWRCDLDADFCNSLKTCKALRTLEIIWPGMSVDHMQNMCPMSTIIDYKFIGDVICQSFPLLEKLVLEPREAYFGENCRQLRSLDLSSMTSLQELAVEACALWGEHAIDSRLPQDIEAPLPGLQDVLPPSIRKLSVLVHRRCDRPLSEVEEVEEIKLQRNQMLILNGALRYLVDAPLSLRSVHLDMPSQEVHEGFDRLDEFFDELGFTRSVVNADPEVQRASPVVGTSTPKDQRVKLRDTFSMWLPGTDRWPTVVIKRLEDAKTEADLARWRAVLDEKVEEARR